MPDFQTSGAGGIDLYTRAIVSVDSDPRNPALRKTLYDFGSKIPREFRNNVERQGKEYIYLLYPGEKIRISVGIAIELPRNQVAYLHPRGNTNNAGLELFGDEEMKIQVKNGAVPIDSDYRGEPSAILYNDKDSKGPFHIFRNRRIVQLVRDYVAVDRPNDMPMIVDNIHELTATRRQFGQNSSTGL